MIQPAAENAINSWRIEQTGRSHGDDDHKAQLTEAGRDRDGR
jgi:hypothetical protein